MASTPQKNCLPRFFNTLLWRVILILLPIHFLICEIHSQIISLLSLTICSYYYITRVVVVWWWPPAWALNSRSPQHHCCNSTAACGRHSRARGAHAPSTALLVVAVEGAVLLGTPRTALGYHLHYTPEYTVYKCIVREGERRMRQIGSESFKKI